jgi:hypothetical protein
VISFRKRRVWLSAVAAVVALAALLLGFTKSAAHTSSADPGQESSERVKFNQPKRTIDVGMHIVNIYQFSMRDKLYSVEGWYWLRWPNTIQEIMDASKIKIKPGEMIEFKNAVEALKPERDTSAPSRIGNNYHFARFKFSGRFYVDDLNLRKSPFETFNLPFVIETLPNEFACNSQGPNCVYLRPYSDDAQALVGEYADINGFKLIGSSSKSSIYHYQTNFGEGTADAFPRVEFHIRYKTEFWSAFIQDVLPLLIILAFVLVSPSLPNSMGDVRLAIPATALLTLIFIQQTYRSEIPSLSYLTFMDWLYAFAYIVSMSLFILFCWDTYRYTVASEDARPATAARISGIDTAFQRIAIVGLGVTVLLAWVFTSTNRLA